LSVKEQSYQSPVIEVLDSLGVRSEQGLDEAETVNRAKQFGPNTIQQKKPISPWKILLEQFQDFLIIILLVAAVVSILLGERTDGILILAIVAAVAVVGFLNEYKAEKTIDALKKLVALKAKVRRSGEIVEIDASSLVPGDIVLLEEGQKVPADIRLLEAIALQADEASLTGESQPIYKQIEAISGDIPLGDRTNMVYSGTVLTSGKGTGVVVATGGMTEIGKIAHLVDQAEDEETPMQKKLDRLGQQLGYGILVVCTLVFVVIFFLDKDLSNLPLLRRLTFAFIASVALAVAAIPEGLAFVVRISLALGARRMAKRQALIRKLPAVEALGSTDTICSDKTGTLTKGEMTAREVWSNDVTYSVSGEGYAPEGDFLVGGTKATNLKPIQRLLEIGALCNNAQVKEGKVLGDPTEGALLVAFQKSGLPESSALRTAEIPFSSDRKMMTTVHKASGQYLTTTKGAAEVVLQHCDQILSNGMAVTLTPELRQQIIAMDHDMSARALRVLGLAYKENAEVPPEGSEAETGLIFAGLVGIMDPPRHEIKEAIAKVTGKAGIKVIMITGDHVETAKAIGREIGLVGEALTGPELDALSQPEFERKAESITIYARVSPEHKIRIVQALQKHGHQVAMTGDGVNDAPAIKAADIGIAMGITGTDVAKEAADVILLDDHFLTIVNAVEEGRGIFDNVRKFVNYLLSCNIAEVLLVSFGVLAFGKLILTAVQLLFINIVTDGLPAVALGSDPAEKGIMNRPPKHFQGNIVNHRLWLEMFIFGTIMTILLGWQFAYNLPRGGLEHAVAVAFTGTVVLEMVRLVNLRSDYRIGWKSNPWLIGAVFSSLLLQAIVVFSPGLSEHFTAAGLDGHDWVVIAISGVILFVAMKVAKMIINKTMPEKAPQLTA
jgi:P-type Ca2+ transporter type 2C